MTEHQINVTLILNVSMFLGILYSQQVNFISQNNAHIFTLINSPWQIKEILRVKTN